MGKTASLSGSDTAAGTTCSGKRQLLQFNQMQNINFGNAEH